MKKRDLDWPGWSLKNNIYGKDFDLAARKRMIKGSKLLNSFIKKYNDVLGDTILEVGPFFNPLVIQEYFFNKTIFFWENDPYVLKWISNHKMGKRTFSINCDLNNLKRKSVFKLRDDTKKCFKKCGLKKIVFDSVIISQVFNYIDYKYFLKIINEFVKKDGLIFINNVVDYGIPLHFSKKRPRSMEETIKSIKDSGYEIIDKKTCDSSNKKYQKNKRLIVVARRKY